VKGMDCGVYENWVVERKEGRGKTPFALFVMSWSSGNVKKFGFELKTEVN